MRKNAIGKSKQVSTSMSGPNRNKKSETRVYIILNEYQFWKIQVSRITISMKEPNKRQIGKLENALNSIENIYKY